MSLNNIPTSLHAKNIDEVLLSLDRIIRWATENNQRIGYFAALYRKVTAKVKQGIANGEFEDGKRMEKLDVIFANRFLDAFEMFHQGEKITQSWLLCFETSHRWYPLVLQHLMLAMNAHINLDLGIAAAETVSGSELAPLEQDFNRINSLLVGLIEEVEQQLASMWPLFSLLDRFAGKLDERLASAAMVFARDQAWLFAKNYATAEDQQAALQEKDRQQYHAGLLLLGLSWYRWFAFICIRFGERGKIADKIRVLQ